MTKRRGGARLDTKRQAICAASNIDPRMPNGAIAPGGVFVIKGTGLGPTTTSIAPAAFQATSLSGTSVKITVNGTAVDALMYYTSATQIGALLPSNTPAGNSGTITVTYNGKTSAATVFPGVVANNLGIFTIDSSGTGPAIVTFPESLKMRERSMVQHAAGTSPFRLMCCLPCLPRRARTSTSSRAMRDRRTRARLRRAESLPAHRAIVRGRSHFRCHAELRTRI